ncbi:MAG TPA: PQQ-dependent sugar dehydrogenase [Rubrobacteraceae bacterium]|nr:PQQ-dependent sugar dehydrogenase [Rubrobacteraceae bacterium]
MAVAVALILLTVFAGKAWSAANLPTGFTQTRVATGLDNPTAMAFAPDGRIFVNQQGGKLRVIKNGTLLAAPAIDLTSRIDARGERGLLGVAFDPGFSSNHWIYLYYTRKAAGSVPAHNRVARFRVVGDRLVASSQKVILDLNNLSSATNHNGGAIHFGSDRKLYVAVGENANGDNSQSFKNLLGKMLRINKDGTMPRDNPFYKNKNVTGKNKAIWARGLRNPYSFAVQPGTGRIYINDVGAQTWEEINAGRKGANYGWPIKEGPESAPKYTPPIFAYRHGNSATTGCAITGGAFYNTSIVRFPSSFVGDYFFADFCNGWIRRYDPATDRAAAFATGIQNPVDLRVNNGYLYYLERGTGSLYQVDHPGA